MLGPVQWHALRSQRRLDVMMAAEALAPCSIAELGRAMGCRPAGLYRHVRSKKAVQRRLAVACGTPR